MKDDAIVVIAAYFILIILLKAAFYQEPLLSVIRIVASLYWLFLLPGMALSYFFFRDVTAVERIIISFIMGAACVGLILYFSGLLGVNLKYMSWLGPILVIGIAGYLIFRREKKESG